MIALLLAAASTITVNVEESAELPLATAVKIAGALAGAIGERTGARVVVDDPTWSGCKSEDRCLHEIAGRTQAEGLVLLRVFGGALSHRLIAERFRERTSIARAELDISAEREAEWGAVLAGAAATLFPDSSPITPLVEPRAVIVEPRATSPWPFVALGAGATIAVAGVVLGVGSAHARDRLESEVLAEPEYNALYRRSTRDQAIANTMFGFAGAALITGVVLLLID